MDYDAFMDTVSKNMSATLGVSEETARGYADAVLTFTGNEYVDIRWAVQNDVTSGEYGMKGAACEDFIRKSIETGNGWNDGPTYRGITVDDATLADILIERKNKVIDVNMGAMASWSTSKAVAEEFSGYGLGDNQVVFVHEGKSQMGVSVKNISSSGTHDHEVMVSKDAMYKPTGRKAEQRNGIWYVYVEEA